MPTSDDFNRFQKGCAFLTGFLECLLYGGVIYGWADLSYVMKSEGIFYDKCGNTTNATITFRGGTTTLSCKAQDEWFNNAFTAAAFGRGVASLLVSFLLDYAGLRITRLVAICSLVLGGFFIGYTTKEHPYYLFPGSILTSLGGSEIRLADMKIASLFPSYKATVMSIYSGAFSASGAVFLALKYASSDGSGHSTFMYVWAGVSTLMIFPTFLLLPKDTIEAIDKAEKIEQLADGNSDETQRLLADPLEPGLSPVSTQKNSSRRSLCSVSYWLHVYSMGTLLIGMSLYMSSFNPWVGNFPSEEASYLSEIYGFCQLPMLVISPLIGMLMDYSVRKAVEEPDEAKKQRKFRQAGFLSLMCFTILLLLLEICKLYPTLTSLKLSLAVYTLAYPTFNAVAPGYLRIRFHQDHFNKLIGIMGTVCCVAQALQFPLFNWMEKDPHTSNTFLVVWMASTFVNPLHLLFSCK